jgi:hypothetical protein
MPDPAPVTIAVSLFALLVGGRSSRGEVVEALQLGGVRMALACAAVFHRQGPRVAQSRLGIYSSLVQGGPQLDKDPDTAQPLAHLIVTLNASIQSIPA